MSVMRSPKHALQIEALQCPGLLDQIHPSSVRAIPIAAKVTVTELYQHSVGGLDASLSASTPSKIMQDLGRDK